MRFGHRSAEKLQLWNNRPYDMNCEIQKYKLEYPLYYREFSKNRYILYYFNIKLWRGIP